MEYCKIAMLSYEEKTDKFYEEIPGIKHVYFYDSKKKDNGKSDAQLFTIIKDNTIIFSVRGTESLNDVKTDLSFIKVPFQDVMYANSVDTKKYKDICVHKGFLDQFNTVKYSVMATIFGSLWSNSPIKNVIFTGHSLGGAIATLLSACVKAHFQDKFIVECYTFGSPRCGNKDFVRYFDDHVDVSIRFVNKDDIVTNIPKLFYYHVKGYQQLGNRSKSFLKKIFGNVENHFIKNYLESFNTKCEK